MNVKNYFSGQHLARKHLATGQRTRVALRLLRPCALDLVLETGRCCLCPTTHLGARPSSCVRSCAPFTIPSRGRRSFLSFSLFISLSLHLSLSPLHLNPSSSTKSKSEAKRKKKRKKKTPQFHHHVRGAFSLHSTRPVITSVQRPICNLPATQTQSTWYCCYPTLCSEHPRTRILPSQLPLRTHLADLRWGRPRVCCCRRQCPAFVRVCRFSRVGVIRME